MKIKTIFMCNECGFESAKWLGKCPACASWNTMVEEVVQPAQPVTKFSAVTSSEINAKTLSEVSASEEERFSSGMNEFDRVLGGGIVKGSLILVGGDPGIGKSTILLQICNYIGENRRVLYISGEESQKQIKLRADRLGVNTGGIKVLAETNMEVIQKCIDAETPDLIIIDSVQTMFRPEIASAPGNITQIREVTMQMMKVAKERNISIFLVGHVTKEGAIAGPKVLEHIVDCVLYFEGDRHQSYRILRGVKNRFGSTNEIGVFEMVESGLAEVPNPSLALLSGRPEGVPGSCVICTMEGTRPVLAEIQALTAESNFGNPRRMSTGFDNNRVILLLAVLEKRLGLRLSAFDAYVNVVGGFRISEPAADLGVVLAIASSYKNTAIPADFLIIGEVGLTGEIRACSNIEQRISEAEKLGFKKIIVPAANVSKVKCGKGINLFPVKAIKDAMDVIF